MKISANSLSVKKSYYYYHFASNSWKWKKIVKTLKKNSHGPIPFTLIRILCWTTFAACSSFLSLLSNTLRNYLFVFFIYSRSRNYYLLVLYIFFIFNFRTLSFWFLLLLDLMLIFFFSSHNMLFPSVIKYWIHST